LTRPRPGASLDGLVLRPTLLTAATLATALGAACSRSSARATGPAPRRAFYYWRTTLRLADAERGALARLHVDRLYVRFFDVDGPAAAPRVAAPVEVSEALPAGLDVVPVVFLRADVWRDAPPGAPAELAGKVWGAVDALARRAGVQPHELQLDCDWADTTRAAYFAFLERVRALARANGVATSATIRLHQVKYRERTGVPPAC